MIRGLRRLCWDAGGGHKDTGNDIENLSLAKERGNNDRQRVKGRKI